MTIAARQIAREIEDYNFGLQRSQEQLRKRNERAAQLDDDIDAYKRAVEDSRKNKTNLQDVVNYLAQLKNLRDEALDNNAIRTQLARDIAEYKKQLQSLRAKLATELAAKPTAAKDSG